MRNNSQYKILPTERNKLVQDILIEKAMDKDYIIRNEQKNVLKIAGYMKGWDIRKY